MARHGGQLLATDAEILAKKLDAKVDRNAKHIKAKIYHEGQLIVTFGWCHDRKKNNGHIPKNLHLSPKVTLEMAKCNHDRDYYIRHLRQRGVIS